MYRVVLGHPGHREIGFGWGNLVVGRVRRDSWAVYQLGARKAAESQDPGAAVKVVSIRALCDLLQADFSLLRVTRPWSFDDYAIGFEAVADVRHTRRAVLKTYVLAQRSALEALGSYTVDVFLSVRLPTPPAALTEAASLAWLSRREASVYQRVQRCGCATRAEPDDLRRVVQRAFRRGLPDLDVVSPVSSRVDERPRFPGLERPEPERLDGPMKAISKLGRSLQIESERGSSHQSFLRVETLGLPGAESEEGIRRLLGRLEAVEFPVDVAVTTLRVSNRQTTGVLVDAPADARKSTAPPRPGVVDAVGVSLGVGAASAAELERRVVRLRRALSGIRLRRSAGEQLELFGGHLPRPMIAAGTHRAGLSVDQLGTLSLTREIVGSRAGPYLGHTATGAPHPVLFDPFEAARAGARGPTLLSGAPRSGKTLCLELIMYQAFVAGAAVIDVDLAGDHALEQLPDVARQSTVLELSAATRFRGLLDPLRVAPVSERAQLATDFLVGVISEPVPATWRLAIAQSVQAVVRNEGRSCAQVVRELRRRGKDGRHAARAIEIGVAAGPATLAFGRDDQVPWEPAPAQMTTLRMRDLPSEPPGTNDPRLIASRRVRRVISRLVVTYALRLASSHRDRPCILSIDDPSLRAADPAGRDLVSRLTSRVRERKLVAMIAFREVEEAGWLRERFGTFLCFRVPDDRQAGNVARLVQASVSDAHLMRGLADARPGCCVMRDHNGHLDAVQIEFVDDRLLAALDTTPKPSGGSRRATDTWNPYSASDH